MEVNKVWSFAANSGVEQVDVENGSGKWPKDVTVTVILYKTVNGEKSEEDSVDLKYDKTSHTFTGLPLYEGMNAVTYSVAGSSSALFGAS